MVFSVMRLVFLVSSADLVMVLGVGRCVDMRLLSLFKWPLSPRGPHRRPSRCSALQVFGPQVVLRSRCSPAELLIFPSVPPPDALPRRCAPSPFRPLLHVLPSHSCSFPRRFPPGVPLRGTFFLGVALPRLSPPHLHSSSQDTPPPHVLLPIPPSTVIPHLFSNRHPAVSRPNITLLSRYHNVIPSKGLIFQHSMRFC